VVLVGRPSKLIPIAQKVISQYPGMKLTVRQIFYRFVSMGVFPNTQSSYNTLDKALTIARQRGLIPFEIIEDRVREFIGGENPFSNATPDHVFNNAVSEYESAEETLQDSWQNYSLPYWHDQPEYVEVWLEKDALAGVFQRVTDNHNVCLAPCRGYPSLSFLYEAVKRLNHINKGEKEIVILYFGDFDMRGIDIQRHLTESLNLFHLGHVVVKRVALTKQQIAEHNLPPQPSKKTDTMSRGWIETHGDVAWELDALDPHILVQIIKEAIEENIDKPTLEIRKRAIDSGQEQIRQKIKEYFNKNEG
jgi:hypothetical protein